MVYQPLARKYRPEQFADLIGQEAVSQALVNAIRLGREPCGIIFSGVRGIGKTSSARVFAKALNCDAASNSEPCNQCYSCKAIAGTYHEDVIEIDGASNNGVSEIRALQETLGYTPQRSRFKVYIIDEVHMLSNSAFNALLKTLEEPPPRVIFILATTELHKVPKTVISRCQTFYLKRVTAHAIQKRMQEILIKEQLPYEIEALSMIAQEANGSVRDALTLLDQVIALGAGSVKRESLKLLLTSLSNAFFIKFLQALIDVQAAECLKCIAELNQEGVEFDSVVEDLCSFLRHAMILKSLGIEANDDSLAKLTHEDKLALHTMVQNIPDQKLHDLFHQLMACSKDMEASWLDRFVFENYCLEWCFKLEQNSMQKTPYPHPPMPQQTRVQQQQPLPPVSLQKPTGFPASWEEFMSRVKQHSPFQGRKLEELSLLEFSQNKIRVAVDPKSFFGEEILKPEAQKKFTQLFFDAVEFKGVFEVRDKTQLNAHVENISVPESSLDEKTRKDMELRKSLEEQAHKSPMTQAILKEFGGKIEKTDIHL